MSEDSTANSYRLGLSNLKGYAHRLDDALGRTAVHPLTTGGITQRVLRHRNQNDTPNPGISPRVLAAICAEFQRI